jgi:hypothetical protein
MHNKFSSPSFLLKAVMQKIVQDVPETVRFCEFECTRLRCTLETTGTCDIHPNLSLVMPGLIAIMPAPAAPTSAWTPAKSPTV